MASICATGDLLEVRGHDGQVRRFAPAELDRVRIVPSSTSTRKASGGDSADADPTRRQYGYAQLCRGEDVLVDLDLDVWGTGVPYARCSPAWREEAPEAATGTAAVAEVLGLRVEHAEHKLPVPRRVRGLVSRPLRQADAALTVTFVVGPLLLIVLGLANLLGGDAPDDLSSTVAEASNAAIGLQQLTGLLLIAGAAGVAGRLRKQRRGAGEELLAPTPADPAPRDLIQRARVLRWRNRLVVQGADGRERVIPSAADRNGPVTASLRARGSSLQRRPERLQLRDGHDTVLLDLDWADWFGGDPGGVERLCAEAGVAPPGDEVLDDDLPEEVRPWGAEQAGRTTPAVGWSRSAFAYFAVLQVAIATTAGTQARWPIWPGWAAVVALLLTGVLPWVARRWWGRRLVPTPVTTSAPAGAWER